MKLWAEVEGYSDRLWGQREWEYREVGSMAEGEGNRDRERQVEGQGYDR